VALLALLPFPTCLVRLVAGVPCPGCGFTRAVLLLAHGRVGASARMHPLAAPCALLIAATLTLAVALPEADPRWDRWTRRALAACSVGFAVAWALRLLGVLPPV
jgi:hypothetical protein